jgi:hypothetical protein
LRLFDKRAPVVITSTEYFRLGSRVPVAFEANDELIAQTPEASGIVGIVLLVLFLGALLIRSGRRGALANA